MPYDVFLAQHPELQGLDQPTIDLAYSQYCEMLDEALEALED